MSEHFDDQHIHTTLDCRHFRHGDGAEVDGDGEPIDYEVIAERLGVTVEEARRVRSALLTFSPPRD
jgi:hypothetical protein